LLVPSYTGPLFNIRNSGTGATSDFYADKFQTYLTTGAGGTGTSYATWIGANTGYITRMYDQGGTSNDLYNTTNSTQPTLVLNSGKYIIRWQNSLRQILTITTPCRPNTVFCHFYNDSFCGTFISTNYDYGLRFAGASNDYNVNGGANQNDWYYSGSGTKLAYANGVNITSNGRMQASRPNGTTGYWEVLSVSVTTPNWNTVSTNMSFTQVGVDGYYTGDSSRSINGYMVDIFCNNTTATSAGMLSYYADRLF